MNTSHKLLLACALACVQAWRPAVAAPAARDAGQEAAPVARSDNGFAYVCGGVGSTEAAQMKRAAGHYNMMLTFAEAGGAYLADVKVTIADLRGNNLLDTVCDAPIMLLNFPRAGAYRVSAEVAGQTRSRVVQVRRHGRNGALALLWPRGVVERAAQDDRQGSLVRPD
ncbi:hypothetical protein ACFOLJ_21295 [Rugamonas sp. CCM 8940]|uniref:carboxypeptidase regulatory-like domain-containing protein n=1 Tax=Rugamonas sp. CCM 8940 TaxID=2765359 RepID=UPI0018F30CFC|nr:carboxypeptidase regulatory-like domain-containing protein [Rugamonas sp. CCM 8940]MBJ7312643.1 carboxypeptidase regulatory-like domain-containing protein [Rugamonas sp. CCM 8940]